MYQVALKTYDVDYGFILRNYLDQSLWDKIWNIFEYREYKVNMKLYQIEIPNKVVTLRFTITNNEHREYEDVRIYLNSLNFKVLKKQINGAIDKLIHDIESSIIKDTEEYQEVDNSYYTEQEELRAEAEEILDEKGIEDEDVREAYIDKYWDNNRKYWDRINKFMESKKETVLVDLYLEYYKSIGETGCYNEIALKNNLLTIDNSKVSEAFRSAVQAYSF